jgi:DNA-binding NarL/FixJ family response regulator
MPAPKGRPRQIDDAEVAKLRTCGLSLADIADQLGVTRGAIQAALKRVIARAPSRPSKS